MFLKNVVLVTFVYIYICTCVCVCVDHLHGVSGFKRFSFEPFENTEKLCFRRTLCSSHILSICYTR